MAKYKLPRDCNAGECRCSLKKKERKRKHITEKQIQKTILQQCSKDKGSNTEKKL